MCRFAGQIMQAQAGSGLPLSLQAVQEGLTALHDVVVGHVTQAIPRAAARWAKIYCAMGLRQMLPWHTKSS